MLGRFLELSLPTSRILDSWHFYRRLGFTEAPAGEIWPHRYAVVTDGRLALGLHDAPLAGPVLTYVQPGLSGRLAALEAAGVRFQHCEVGEDTFNEALFASADGQHVRLVEARTYSPPERVAPTVLGWFEECALPVTDLGAARAYWEGLGFVTTAEDDAPWPHLSLTSDTLDIGLHLTRELSRPTLVFSNDDGRALRERIDELGVEPDGRLPRLLDPDSHLLLVAPEGTRLLIGPPPA